MEEEVSFEGLEEPEIESWIGSPGSYIYPKIRGGLFHRTSILGYRGIREEGQILPNRGQFSFSYPQSAHSYALTMGYVALFDFSQVRDRHCISIHDTWEGFFFDQQLATIVLQLNRELLSQKLIPNEAAKESGLPNDQRYHIPYVEAWYPEPIPFSAVEGLILSMSRGLDVEPLFEELTVDEIDLFERTIKRIEDARQGGLQEMPE